MEDMIIFRRPMFMSGNVWCVTGLDDFRDRRSNGWMTKAAMMTALGLLRRDGYVRTHIFEYSLRVDR